MFCPLSSNYNWSHSTRWALSFTKKYIIFSSNATYIQQTFIDWYPSPQPQNSWIDLIHEQSCAIPQLTRGNLAISESSQLTPECHPSGYIFWITLWWLRSRCSSTNAAADCFIFGFPPGSCNISCWHTCAAWNITFFFACFSLYWSLNIVVGYFRHWQARQRRDRKELGNRFL